MIHKGFNYLGKTYILKEDVINLAQADLFRLPFESHLRFYGVKKCKHWKDGFILGNGIRKSKGQISSMLTDIETDFKFIEEKDCPF
jgi:hypothetical protein